MVFFIIFYVGLFVCNVLIILGHFALSYVTSSFHTLGLRFKLCWHVILVFFSLILSMFSCYFSWSLSFNPLRHFTSIFHVMLFYVTLCYLHISHNLSFLFYVVWLAVFCNKISYNCNEIWPPYKKLTLTDWFLLLC